MVGSTGKPGSPAVFLGPRPWRRGIHEGATLLGDGAGLERQRDRARALGLAIEAQRRFSLEVCEADNGPRVPLQTFSPGGCSTSGHHGKRKLAFGLLSRSPVWSFLRQKLLNRPQYPLPHRIAVRVALIEHRIRTLGVLAFGVITGILA